MKKKLIREYENKLQYITYKQSCKFCPSSINNSHKGQSLIFKNYLLLSNTLNRIKHRQQSLGIINTLVQKKISKQLIKYQQIQKNLQNQEYLTKYFDLVKLRQRIKKIINKNANGIKSNYMDFKLKNYYILNKYRVVETKYLPYPICNKLQKQSDSKMSSTKSIENKVLPDLEVEMREFLKRKQNKATDKKEGVKKYVNNKNVNKSKKKQNQKFFIKGLINNIQDMMQDIKDNRALEQFKKQMESKAKFNLGVINNGNKVQNSNKGLLKKTNYQRQSQKAQDFLTNIKEKQFKRKVQNDMINFHIKKKSSKQKRMQIDFNKNIYGIKVNKDNQVMKDFENKEIKQKQYNKKQRLKTYYDTEFEQYGLSIIKQKTKKSNSKLHKNMKQKSSQHKQGLKNSKSKSKSKSKNSSFKNLLSASSKRLQTQYSCASSQRMNTIQGQLIKSKSSSRIPTEYDSTIIFKNHNKSKSKSKYQDINQYPMFSRKLSFKVDNLKQKNQMLSSRPKSKSKSKQKHKLFHFKSQTKFKQVNF